jgi:hypothetical protein
MEVETVVYIGSQSSDERKRWFIEAYSDRSLLLRSDDGKDKSENPWSGKSWPSQRDLERGIKGLISSQQFLNRYAVSEKEKETGGTGYTRPVLYDTHFSHPSKLFASLLQGSQDLVTKLTPLFSKKDDSLFLDDEALEEIYSEVRISYFLLELQYGYRYLLSLHFLQIVDWFPLAIPADSLGPAEHYQVTISERLDITLGDLFIEQPPSLAEIRCLLFQLFNALEVAWLTHRFVHHDLHPDNVMIKRVTATSSLYGRHLLYRRFNDDDSWWMLDQKDWKNQLVKIIDFGRSRINIPCGPDLCTEESHQHVCSLGPPSGYEKNSGYGPTIETNPYYDVRLFFQKWLLTDRFAAAEFLDSLEKENVDEVRQFYDMASLALGLEEKSGLLLDYDEVLTIPLIRATASLRNEYSSLVRSEEQFGASPNELLNHPFFHPLRKQLTSSKTTDFDAKGIDEEHVVVSFAVDWSILNSGLPLGKILSTQQQQLCTSCKRPALYETPDKEAFCGRVCYDFHYCFGKKTFSE